MGNEVVNDLGNTVTILLSHSCGSRFCLFASSLYWHHIYQQYHTFETCLLYIRAPQSKGKQCEAKRSNAHQCTAKQCQAKRSNAKRSNSKQCKSISVPAQTRWKVIMGYPFLVMKLPYPLAERSDNEAPMEWARLELQGQGQGLELARLQWQGQRLELA